MRDRQASRAQAPVRRRGATAPLLLPASLLAAVLAAPAAPAAGSGGPPEAGSAAKRPGPSIRLVTRSQRAILRAGALRVRVRSRRRGGLVLRVLSSTFDEPRLSRLTRRRKLRLRRGGRRVVHLKLTRAGRRAIASCAARRLTVRAVRTKRAGGRKRSVRRAGGALARTTRRCRPKPIDLSAAGRCEFIGRQPGSHCLLPFPSNHLTAPDPSAPSGRRIAFETASMPRNRNGTPIDAAPYRRSDGFSPGATILARVPGLDSPAALARTGAVPINRLGRYSDPSAPVVVIDAETGERHPIWVELDVNAGTPARTLLEVHPAVNFASGRRYIVAMRRLRTASGQTIAAPEGFRYYRDRLASKRAPIKARRAHFESIFRTLRGAGIRRSNLYLAWDFTVASDENLAERMLHIRDHAFAGLGDDELGDLQLDGAAPDFEVTDVQELAPAQSAQIARRVFGELTVPCYLFPSCAPGGRFQLDAANRPIRNGDWTASFQCIIPRVGDDGPAAAAGRPATYGHGLFGSAGEVFNSSAQRALAHEHGFVFCATDEIGMSGADVANTATSIIPDLSNFPELADRLQQGMLNGLFLGRLMIHEDGFDADEAFHVDPEGVESPSTIDRGELYYVGASQGAIFGGALTAVAPDFTRAALNVGAMNYSVLLPRSVDYDAFGALIDGAYPEKLTHPLLLALIQMLWDRGEPNGYAHRMTGDPLPGTPAHEVLLQVAFGDHQVTNFQADVEARTVGVSTHQPVLEPGRWPGVDVLWNVPRLADSDYPFHGSAILYGDIGPVRPNEATPDPDDTIGVPPPPLTNVPNRGGEDPHGAPRGAPLALLAISNFLAPDGAVTNVCGPMPCFAGGYTGAP
jgi:hypothetical protein